MDVTSGRGFFVAGAAAAAVVFFACVHLPSCDMNRDYRMRRDLISSEEIAGSLAIMQGVTTETRTQIFVLTEAGSDYLFSLLDGEGRKILPSATNEDGYRDSKQVMQRLLFQGLVPSSSYLFQVRSSSTAELIDERELRTLNPSRRDLRFAFTSCILDSYLQDDIWKHMVALDPDVIFLIGDNVYTDTLKDQTTPSDLWARNFETRARVSLFRNRKLVPVIATWDDHDYGKNNADRDYPHKKESLAVFKTFFASDQTKNFRVPGIGVASFFAIYGYNFFLLDNRTFRTAKGDSPEHHFGEVQSQWLWSNLRGKEHAFLISGDQFFGGYYVKDSFQGHHPRRFLDFVAKLRDLDTKVVFLSGDRHFTEIMKIPGKILGYRTYEFTASPAQAEPREFFFPNLLRVEGKDNVTNFMLVEVSTGLDLRATSYTTGGKILFSGDYTVD